MPHVYLAVGHGHRPDGTYDPGAVTGSITEHEMNDIVAAGVLYVLKLAGVSVVHEVNDQHDPNFSGSWRNANALNAAVALSIHHDWFKGETKVWPLYTSSEGRRWADLVVREAGYAKIPTRTPTERNDLSFLNNTRMPALLVESGRVEPYDRASLVRRGVAIAEGTIEYLRSLGHNIVFPKTTKKDVKKVAKQTQIDEQSAYGREIEESRAFVRFFGISNGRDGDKPLLRRDAWIMLKRVLSGVYKKLQEYEDRLKSLEK